MSRGNLDRPNLHIQANKSLDEDVSKLQFGFWVYLMTDCVLFASLFAVYAVLHNNSAGGEPLNALFSLPYVLVETLVLLSSSFACGMAMINAQRGKKDATLNWFGITGLLGIIFLALELTEFHKLVLDGNSWHRSGALSSYFTLVGTHGLHITIGLLWMLITLITLHRRGLTASVMKRLTLLSMFWHFLDVIWIFIFTIVYLGGAIKI